MKHWPHCQRQACTGVWAREAAMFAGAITGVVDTVDTDNTQARVMLTRQMTFILRMAELSEK